MPNPIEPVRAAKADPHSISLIINGQPISRGSRATVELRLPQLYTHTPLTMPVHVVRGKKDGPRLFVSAAIHGDELNGVEIIRRLLKLGIMARLRGTLIAIPIVNVYGVIHNSRYLPDRRDLNRAFPGSVRGSLASRLAKLFMQEIVAKCSHGIDLHTGAVHRENLPHVRANLDDPETLRLARAFGVPVLINANTRDGSLREAAAEHGISMLVYEAGEALRFGEVSIRAGLHGVVNVLRALRMVPASRAPGRDKMEPFVARSSAWVRAPQSGILRNVTPLGAHIKKGGMLGLIADPFGEQETEVLTQGSGVVIGRTQIPLVHEGEALFHIARFEDAREVERQVEVFRTHQVDAIDGDPEPTIV